MPLVIYDDTGKIWNIIYGEQNSPQNLKCVPVNIPSGMILSGMNVLDPDNPKPVFASSSGESDAEETEHRKLVDSIIDKVTSGENLKEIIGGLSLSNEEKWELEKEVREGL